MHADNAYFECCWFSDVFAYGVTLACLFTANDPYEGVDNPLDLDMHIRTGMQPTLPQEHRLRHPVLADLIGSCVAFEPSERPSFEEVSGILDSVKAHASTAIVLPPSRTPAHYGTRKTGHVVHA